MVKHIVMWKLHDEAQGSDREANANKMKVMLEALPSEIHEIKNLEVGFNFSPSPAAFHMVLVTEFENNGDLMNYMEHPAHKKVAEFIGSVVSERAVVDFMEES